MKKIFGCILIFALLFSLCACGESTNDGTEPLLKDVNDDIGEPGDSFGDSLEDSGAYDGYFEENVNDIKIECISGTTGAYAITGNTVTFSSVSEASVYSISGRLKGNIIIDVVTDCKFELEMCGFSLVSDSINPITVLSGDEVTLTAKKDTKNYVYDMRADVSADELLYSGAIHSEIDTEIGGKGTLTVISENNNGIHSKDDLQIKNLNLLVSCSDNALKGNDSVEIKSGNLTLIATSGDGIKTKNSDISEKGNQRGTVSIFGGNVLIYAARDGIDAAYDVEINSNESTVKIYTDKYSSYTDNSETAAVYEAEAYSAFLVAAPPDMGARPMRPGNPGGGMGAPGGHGGMQEGNQDKSDYSAKGIKASNEIKLSAGSVTVKSYDDSIHAGSDTLLENASYPLGNISVSGAEIMLYSDDDAIHAEGELSVSGGKVYIVSCYEGLEGTTVTVSGGNVSIASSDDAINSTGTSGTGITLSGGELYIYAGGDGIDSNSRTAYSGILFCGTDAVIISTSGGNSAIDTETGYSYSDGAVIALMPKGAMTNEATHAEAFSQIGITKSISAKKEEFLIADIDGRRIIVKMPTDMSGTAVILGDNSSNVSISTENSQVLDKNGIYFEK